MNDTSASGAEKEQVTRRAGIVAGGTLFSRLLGLVREQVLAALFSRAATDAFFVAFLIPNVLRQLLAEGAVQTGVTPVLAQVQAEHGQARAQSFFRALRGLSLLLLGLVSALGVLAAPWLVALFAGGYRQIPGQFERTVELTRWVFPYIFFMGVAALGAAALNSRGRFVTTAYAPALLNVAFIVCALALPTWLQAQGFDPLHALSLGVLLGGALQVVAQWPSLRRIGYHALPTWNLRDPYVRKVLLRMAPVLLGFGIYYLDVVVARHLLSDLGLGAQSYFTFAMRLCDFPQGIFVMAVQTAALPTLARLAAERAHTQLLETMSHGLRLSLFVGIAGTALLVALAQPLVVLVFERGQFDAVASAETARALAAQAAGIWAVSAVRQLVVVFYALGDTRSPVWISALDFGVFLAAALLLKGTLGHTAISWAMTLSSVVQLVLLAVVLSRKLGAFPLRALLQGTSKVVLAAALAGSAASAFTNWLTQAQWFGRHAPAVLGCVLFGTLFLGAAAALRCTELNAITQPLLRRWQRTR